MTEKIIPDERMVNLGMFIWKANIFIHIEGYNILERYFATFQCKINSAKCTFWENGTYK